MPVGETMSVSRASSWSGADTVCLNTSNVCQCRSTEATLCCHLTKSRTFEIPKIKLGFFFSFQRSCIAQFAQSQLTQHAVTIHVNVAALATHVTNSIFRGPKRRTCLMTVRSLNWTVLRYLSQWSTRATLFSHTVDWQYEQEERCYSFVPVKNLRKLVSSTLPLPFPHGFCLVGGWREGG